MAGRYVNRLKAAACYGWLASFLAAAPALAWSPADLFAPCAGDCAVSIFGGSYVEDSLVDIVFDPISPTSWDYRDDYLIATTVARNVGRAWRLTFEPEAGIGQRFGKQDETEFWGAFFIRYHGFPWDRYLVTTFAISTGLSWVTGISEIEKERARDGEGSQLMHYFAPEVTFALPSHPDVELMFRIHHRSGVFGIVSNSWGGAQYGTVGLRVRF